MNTVGGTLPTVGIHQETHPTYVEGCDLCRWTSVSVAPSATPSRGGGQDAARINAKEKEWAKDMRAYRAIRANGLQPRGIDGAARLEHASDRMEVEAGSVFTTKEQRREAREGIARAQEMIADAS